MAFDTEGKTFWGFAETLSGGTASRIKVYGEKKNDEYLKYSEEELKNQFPPAGKVFVTKPIYSYHTFRVEENTRKKDNDDEYLAVFQSWKPITFSKLITIPQLENTSYFPLEEIQKLCSYSGEQIEEGTYYIWVKDENELIGPFVKDQRRLSPKIGKEASVFTIKSNFDLYVFDKNRLLFSSPEKLQDTFEKKLLGIDCMSNDQLQEWFKDKIKNASVFDDKSTESLLTKIKASFVFVANDLDTVRLNRVLECLDQYKFTYDELKDLFNNEGFGRFNKQIENMRTEIKNEYEKELLKDFEELKNEKHKLENEKRNILTEIQKLNLRKEDLRAETSEIENTCKSVEAKYDELLLSLKVNARINTESQSQQNVNIMPTFFEIGRTGNSFESIKKDDDLDQLYVIEKNLSRAGYDDNIFELYKNDDAVLLKAQAVFIPCISWAYIYAQSIGNARVYTMHIEHDWLHYHDFTDKGLLEIWSEAANDNESNYILVFDNINLTQPECGMMPILDVFNGYRPFLEGTKHGLLPNIKIFATIIPYCEDIGLKLSKRQFASWGTLATPDRQDYNIPVKLENKELYGYFRPCELVYDKSQTPGDSYFAGE